MPRSPLPIGEVLKAIRDELGMSQEKVALRACVTQQLVAAFESGRKQPSLGMLPWLAGALQLRSSEVLQRAERLQDERKRRT